MSRENVGVVRRAVDALNERELELVLSYMTRDIEVDLSEAIGPFRGIYRGHDGVKALWDEILEPWQDLTWEVELRDLGDGHVLSDQRQLTQGRASGIEVTAHAAWIWTLRKGLISRMKLFQGAEDALKAAGLSE